LNFSFGNFSHPRKGPNIFPGLQGVFPPQRKGVFWLLKLFGTTQGGGDSFRRVCDEEKGNLSLFREIILPKSAQGFLYTGRPLFFTDERGGSLVFTQRLVWDPRLFTRRAGGFRWGELHPPKEKVLPPQSL